MEEALTLAVEAAVELFLDDLMEEVKQSPCCLWSRKNMRKKCDKIKERKMEELKKKKILKVTSI